MGFTVIGYRDAMMAVLGGSHRIGRSVLLALAVACLAALGPATGSASAQDGRSAGAGPLIPAPEPVARSAGGTDGARAPVDLTPREGEDPAGEDTGDDPVAERERPQQRRRYSHYKRYSNEWSVTRWAYVEYAVTARVRPSFSAPKRSRIRPFTWSGSPEVVVVLERATPLGSRRSWSKVRYAGLGRKIGWIPTDALSRLHTTRMRVVVHRARRLVTVHRGKRRLLRTRVGIGAVGSPTPPGVTYIRERLVPREKNGIYGVLAFGLGIYSPHRTDWPGGGQVGIHGTNQPEILPGRVSNGCIRLFNPSVRRLDRLVDVGTPVIIR